MKISNQSKRRCLHYIIIKMKLHDRNAELNLILSNGWVRLCVNVNTRTVAYTKWITINKMAFSLKPPSTTNKISHIISPLTNYAYWHMLQKGIQWKQVFQRMFVFISLTIYIFHLYNFDTINKRIMLTFTIWTAFALLLFKRKKKTL